LQAKNIFSANELSDVNFCDPKVLQLPRPGLDYEIRGAGVGVVGVTRWAKSQTDMQTISYKMHEHETNSIAKKY